ncbi:MAG: DUF559 domain-containing protein [Chloroflexota bacterium]|nr:DUF559 domain-containing protein [Chloroflexota bacterium]
MASELAESELLHTLRSHKERPPAKKTSWKRDHIPQLVSVIRKIPDQLGDPDEIANRLSFSLDRAVARLNESQKQELAACLDLPAGKPTKIETGYALTSRFNQAAKRAMLVVATAVMFHSQLDKHRHTIKPRDYAGEWSPASASQCANSADPIGAFSQAWKLWLAVDYKPIFDTARSALQVLAGANEFTASVQIVARASLQVTRNIVGLRHDLLGRIFHKVLDTARYDGSFYTTTAAATLLANLALREDMLDWSDSEAIGGLRVTDPACGTGTLLMAAAERIRDLTSAVGNQDEVSRLLIEKVLTGYDVNLTATHLAATTLGLLSPTTTFENMKIYRALLGIDENNEAKLGSLEFLDTGVDGQPRLLPWPTGVEQIETREESAEAEPADLVIMNPPFTRDSLRHDQFSRAQEQKLKAREKAIFAGQPVHLSSNGNAFMVLAEHIASAQSSAVAAILPLVTATNVSALGIRKFLAKQFHIDTIITSHDPTRIYFSENTSIGEMLLICRRKAPRPPAPSPKMREGEKTSELDSSAVIFDEFTNSIEPSKPAKSDESPLPRPGGGGLGVGAEKWHIPPELERRMQAVARKLRKHPTTAEATLWTALRKRQLDGRKFRRQVAIGAFVVDFYCSTERLAVEVDGPIHDHQIQSDKIRQELIESLGIRFVRLTNDDVENRLEAAIDKIRGAFTPTPNPSPMKREGLSSPVVISLDKSRSLHQKQTSPTTLDNSPSLLVGEEARGWGPPTTIVNLYENPATPADALGVARDIAEDRTENIKGTVQRWPHARIAQGDWGGVQFLSPYLCEKFVELREDEFFAFRELGDMADISPDGRGIRGMFKRSEVPDSKAMIALWDHKTDFTQKMSAHHDTYIITKEGKARQAEYLWAQRGTLLLAMRARLNTVRVVSVRLPERALGSAWVPCKLKSLGATAERALCAYINSTIGLLAMLGDRSLRDLSYSQFSMNDLRRVIVPDFYALEASQVTALATAFDTLCNFTLLPLPQIMQDETRAALDRVVIDALDIAPEVVANIRRELSREPSITGKPYES